MELIKYTNIRRYIFEVDRWIFFVAVQKNSIGDGCAQCVLCLAKREGEKSDWKLVLGGTINGLYFCYLYLFALYFLGIINVSQDDGINVAATQQKLLTQTLPFIPENRAIANKHSIILLYTHTKQARKLQISSATPYFHL